MAQNDGRQGHAHRHSTLLQEVVRIARSVWGARVEIEPDDYLPYSTYRPDMAVPYAGESGSTYLGSEWWNLPFFCYLGSLIGFGHLG